MQSPVKNSGVFIQNITLITLSFIICIGAVMVIAPIKPFWVDEWFIISSLKTKSSAELMGQLNFMQQFPRIYLELFKSFSSFFNYSYSALRLPSFLVSAATIILSYKVMKKLYGQQVFTRYLFVLLLASSFTFCEYFVEVKQYAMDILLSVVAIWQLIELLNLGAGKIVNIRKYIFLCAGFFIAPFFSYTYPIAIAPAYGIILLQTIGSFKNKGNPTKWKTTLLQWIPLLTSALGIALFYIIDAKQLATDKCMYERWSFLMIDNNHKIFSFLTGCYTLFSQTGAGLLYETIFGILGVSAFILGIVSCIKNYIKKEQSLEVQVRAYCCLLLSLTIILYLFRRLPLGTPRLNAFTTPSIAILIIYIVNRISINFHSDLKRKILPAILYIGLVGNVFTWYINYFTSPRYKKQMAIYTATQKAIGLAQAKKIPILITPGIAYPYEQATIDAGAPDPAVWVLKTFPAYDVNAPLPVYAISGLDHTKEYLEHLPPGIQTVLVGDGISFQIYNRKD